MQKSFCRRDGIALLRYDRDLDLDFECTLEHGLKYILFNSTCLTYLAEMLESFDSEKETKS